MRHLNPTTVILSAEKYDLSERENVNRMVKLVNLLDGLGLEYKKVYSRYKNSNETSLMVILSDPDQTENLRELADQFEQESILVLNPDRTAYLLFADGGESHFGLKQFREISANTAKELDNTTFDPETNKHYAMI